ncbi:uncharacterized protein LOC121376110 [Gigantopelta aegis]|uniref:uncharacterized protein LOC121376110 n=1 Tax=Gigantopelta aegis TaxID=1735272 RepID=UPI001B889EE1|nr:uncharacterized protein LOC121376110 [Gigantopelta aegis]
MAESYNTDTFHVSEGRSLLDPQQPYTQQPGYGAHHGYGPPTHQGYGPPPRGYEHTHTVYEEHIFPPTCPVGQPPDYLILSLISCCFCWPLALAAVVASFSSRNASDSCDYDKARRHGELAKNIAISAIVCGVVLFCIFIIVRIVGYSHPVIHFRHEYANT